MLTVTTVNVNGLRAAAKKGFVPWLEATAADVVCLQEVRAEPGQLPGEVREPDGWHVVHAPAAAKGRAGVSVYSRREFERVRIGFGSDEFDSSGRYVEVDLPGVTVASLYLPSGEVGTERQSEKERFMKEFLAHLAALRAQAEAGSREAVVCGDWNIAHREADLKNWKSNTKNAGFLPEERAWLSRVYDDAGYVDVVRRLRTPRSRARTRGGPTAAAPSTTTPASADRPGGGHPRAGRARRLRGGRARGEPRGALVRPRARDRRLRRVGPVLARRSQTRR